MRLDPFYPILQSSGWMRRLVPRGVRLVQLRIKSEDVGAVRKEIAESLEICRQHDCLLIVNDHWRLAIELGCEAVHLGQEDLDGADLEAIAEAGIGIGVSTHSPDELDRALSVRPHYVALGPIYPTVLKKMPWAPQGLERIAKWKSRTGALPLVAIGGLNPERARAALEHGADIVSVVTDITLNPKPERRLEKWLEITRPYRKRSNT
ncbi:MAG: thiamine phosphate synthase [Gammaproteobacteria bacterium]|nr:thiamine phosphate synthase [Gammaproteobacteria bacterium]MYD75362.1 thiamine phosphate synthase [Gammaproteobacteria bacterium]MYJ52656.1 thiamine phosphate synthase [Gammaproteobacteria bacterium]